MNVLLAQLAPVPGMPATNAQRAADLITEHGTDLAIFPELYLSGYTLCSLDEVALDVDGPELQAISDTAAASRTSVIVGFTERLQDGFANSLAAIDADGTTAAIYRKVYLYGQERNAFVPGSDGVIATLGGERIGLSICFDIEFPEHTRALARAGATLLATASANMAPFARHHELHTRARALENGLPHVYVNRPGYESGFAFVGESRVIDANGGICEQLGTEEEVRLAALPDPRQQAPNLRYLEQTRNVPVRTCDSRGRRRGAGARG